MDDADHHRAGKPLGIGGTLSLPVASNYAVVAGEIAVLPLVLNLPLVAAIFTVVNAAVLAIRIRAESRALAARETLARGAR